MEELIIDDSNFNDYFFDVRTNSPKKDHIIACYTAKAELISGEDKKRLIDILLTPGAGVAASQFMKKIFMAIECDSISIPIEILNDLKHGLSIDTIMDKNYSYTMQMLFYTKKDYIPKDGHWTTMEIITDNIMSES